MKQKFAVLMSFFILLLVINLYIGYHVYRINKKTLLIRQVLDDINRIPDPNSQFTSSRGPLVMGVYEAEVKLSDGRVANLKNFFRRYNSPLYDHAEKIVEVSDKYQFDYRLLPAIAMQESNLCRYIPDDSYNCWGWGIYGTTVTRFESYEEAIDTVAAGIKKEYIDKGLITLPTIMQKYTPPSTGSWAYGVTHFFKILE